MAIICVDNMKVLNGDGTEAQRCVLISSDTPASLNITGADVTGLGDSDTIAAGSVLITPDANYIAFEDGTFTEKE